jgi:hypothetical protein
MSQDTPNVIYGIGEDYKKLYYSDPRAALKVPITLSPGYGVLKMGTALAVNTSGTSATAGNAGKFFPYDPTGTGVTGTEVAPGRSYLVQTQDTGTAEAEVLIPDSYRFVVGDDIIICDSDGEVNMDNGGAIISIDRTTYTNYAVITFTTNTGDSFTTAKFAFATIEGCFAAVGILEKSVDTGYGENAKGANATMILGNAVLHTGMLIGVDTNAQTDLSISTLGQFSYMP